MGRAEVVAARRIGVIGERFVVRRAQADLKVRRAGSAGRCSTVDLVENAASMQAAVAPVRVVAAIIGVVRVGKAATGRTAISARWPGRVRPWRPAGTRAV
jgi:hypothetical protein